MAQQTCPSCYGSGSYLATERIPNPAGGMFQEIQVRKICLQCNGTGTIWSPDPVKSVAEKTNSTRNQTGHSADEDFETIVSGWIFVCAWLGVSYYGISIIGFEWYWAVLAGFLLGLIFQKLFAGPLRFLLTGLKYLLLIVIVGAALVFEVNLIQNGT